ncbi:hypothetical protein ElyMa_002131500 [Elysia marginata]|uniref:Uncharacterized protein n=1 Tax=Elysia marginata TaxID=1093978 RepID=A0AAV4FIS5_9GAST|nr:hypothetical protein ElyMa_002131500 [Elysia marginata]
MPTLRSGLVTETPMPTFDGEPIPGHYNFLRHQLTISNQLSTHGIEQRFCGTPGKTLDSAELDRAEGGRSAGGTTKTDGQMRQPPDTDGSRQP